MVTNKLLMLLFVIWSSIAANGQQVPDNYYVVRKGDTLKSVAKKLGIPIAQLRKMNNLNSKDRVTKGQWLMKEEVEVANIITYRVASGDTLAKVAKRFSTSVEQLKSLNELKDNIIQVGQPLRVNSLQHTFSFKKPEFNLAFAHDLAHFAQISGQTKNTHGQCLRGVRAALNKTIAAQDDVEMRTVSTLGGHAVDFLRWAESDPTRLCEETRLADATLVSGSLLKKGLVYLYGPGKCGFSRSSGHVEVVVNPSDQTVCSDHCRRIETPACKPDLILAPVTSCDWL